MSTGAHILILTALTCPPAHAGHTAPQTGRERRPWGGQSVLAWPARLAGQRAPWGPDGGRGHGMGSTQQQGVRPARGWGCAGGGRLREDGHRSAEGTGREAPVFSWPGGLQPSWGHCLLRAWEGPSQATCEGTQQPAGLACGSPLWPARPEAQGWQEAVATAGAERRWTQPARRPSGPGAASRPRPAAAAETRQPGPRAPESCLRAGSCRR